MAPSSPRMSREDALDALAVEPNLDRATLERYLRDYPAYASEIVDLARELQRSTLDSRLAAEDEALIEGAWRQYLESSALDDPLAMLSVDDLRKVAVELQVPRQVIAAFRERRVAITSVPGWFIGGLAKAANTTAELLVASLTRVSEPMAGARSYKSDVKPAQGEAVSFEQILIDAGVPADQRAALMTDRA
jgi:hypothetical protein